MTEERAKECLVIAVQALRDVVNPVGKLNREGASVQMLRHVAAIRWAEQPETMRKIAKDALREIGEAANDAGAGDRTASGDARPGVPGA